MRAFAHLKEKPDEDMETALRNEEYIFWNDYIKSVCKNYDFTEEQFKKDMPLVMVYSSGTTGFWGII